MKTAFRLKHHIRHNPYLRNTHDEALGNALKIKSVLGATCDRLSKPKYIFNKSFRVVVTRDLNDFCRETQWSDASFFTDGSVRNAGGGCGIHCAEIGLNKSIPMGNVATIKQLEITAINECGKIILENGPTGRIAIFTDSLGAIKALRVW